AWWPPKRARGRRPAGDDRGADEDGGARPVRERLARLVAAGVGEDRGQYGDAENAADLADRVRRPRRLAFLLGRNRAEDDVGDRGEEERHAGAGEDERQEE